MSVGSGYPEVLRSLVSQPDPPDSAGIDLLLGRRGAARLQGEGEFAKYEPAFQRFVNEHRDLFVSWAPYSNYKEWFDETIRSLVGCYWSAEDAEDSDDPRMKRLHDPEWLAGYAEECDELFYEFCVVNITHAEFVELGFAKEDLRLAIEKTRGAIYVYRRCFSIAADRFLKWVECFGFRRQVVGVSASYASILASVAKIADDLKRSQGCVGDLLAYVENSPDLMPEVRGKIEEHLSRCDLCQAELPSCRLIAKVFPPLPRD